MLVNLFLPRSKLILIRSKFMFSRLKQVSADARICAALDYVSFTVTYI